MIRKKIILNKKLNDQTYNSVEDIISNKIYTPNTTTNNTNSNAASIYTQDITYIQDVKQQLTELKFDDVRVGTYIDSENIFDTKGVYVSLAHQGNVVTGRNTGLPRRLISYNTSNSNYNIGRQNVLAISNNNITLDTSTDGGVITFTFDQPQANIKINVAAVNNHNSYIVAYEDIQGDKILEQVNLQNIHRESIFLPYQNIARIDVDFHTTGFISNIQFNIADALIAQNAYKNHNFKQKKKNKNKKLKEKIQQLEQIINEPAPLILPPQLPKPQHNNKQCLPGSVPDCRGVCGGNWILDCGGNCYNPDDRKSLYLRDCAGECYLVEDGPTNVPDCMGYCYNTTTEHPQYVRDCKGECYPYGTTPKHELDCAGICGGDAYYDDNEVCILPCKKKPPHDCRDECDNQCDGDQCDKVCDRDCDCHNDGYCNECDDCYEQYLEDKEIEREKRYISEEQQEYYRNRHQ